MPDKHDGSDHPAKTVPLTIRLSPAAMSALRDLAEIYHATPERMAASWVVAEIDRRVAELASPDEPA